MCHNFPEQRLTHMTAQPQDRADTPKWKKKNKGGGKQTTTNKRCHGPLCCLSFQRRPKPAKGGDGDIVPKDASRRGVLRRFSMPERTHWDGEETTTLVMPKDSRTGCLIAPSKDSVRRMRGIGALGMEDPVFGSGQPRRLSHPSQVYEDMSLGDIPRDMQDLISVASDPTALMDSGLDSQLFHSSLGGCDLQHSLSDFSWATLVAPVETLLHSSQGTNSFASSSRLKNAKPNQPYCSSKVDPWGTMNWKRIQPRNISLSDAASATSETQHSTTRAEKRSGVVSLTLGDLTATTPRLIRRARHGGGERPPPCSAPKQPSEARQRSQPINAHTLYWKQRSHTSSVSSSSSSSSTTLRNTIAPLYQLSNNNTRQRRGSTGDISLHLSSSSASSSCCHLKQRLDLPTPRQTGQDCPSRVTVTDTATATAERGTVIRDNKVQHHHSSWMDGVLVVDNPNPLQDASESNGPHPRRYLADIVVEQPTHAPRRTATTTGTSLNHSQSTDAVLEQPRPRLPSLFVVHCASGLEPRLLPTIADIYNSNSCSTNTRVPRRRNTCPLRNQLHSSSSQDVLHPTSVRSFYEEEDPKVVLAATATPPGCRLAGMTVRDSGRYFESTHAVMSEGEQNVIL